MSVSKVNKCEQTIGSLLNDEGWELEWCGGGFEHLDAIGTSTKGKEVILEIK